MIINFKTLNEKMNQEYDFLYENNDNVAGADEATAAFDDFAKNHKQFLRKFVAFRGDFISSDREAAAFMFAVESLDLEIEPDPKRKKQLYEVRQIDAIFDGCDWVWNDSWELGTLKTAATYGTGLKQIFRSWLKKMEITFPKYRTKIIQDGDDIIVAQRDNDRPIIAMIWKGNAD